MSHNQAPSEDSLQKFLARNSSLESLSEEFKNRYFVCEPCGKCFLLPAYVDHKFNFKHKHSTFRDAVLASAKESKSCSDKSKPVDHSSKKRSLITVPLVSPHATAGDGAVTTSKIKLKELFEKKKNKKSVRKISVQVFKDQSAKLPVQTTNAGSRMKKNIDVQPQPKTDQFQSHNEKNRLVGASNVTECAPNQDLPEVTMNAANGKSTETTRSAEGGRSSEGSTEDSPQSRTTRAGFLPVTGNSEEAETATGSRRLRSRVSPAASTTTTPVQLQKTKRKNQVLNGLSMGINGKVQTPVGVEELELKSESPSEKTDEDLTACGETATSGSRKDGQPMKRVRWRSKVTMQWFNNKSLAKDIVPVTACTMRPIKQEEPVAAVGRPFLEAAEEVARRQSAKNVDVSALKNTTKPANPEPRRSFLEVAEELVRRNSMNGGTPVKNRNRNLLNHTERRRVTRVHSSNDVAVYPPSITKSTVLSSPGPKEALKQAPVHRVNPCNTTEVERAVEPAELMKSEIETNPVETVVSVKAEEREAASQKQKQNPVVRGCFVLVEKLQSDIGAGSSLVQGTVATIPVRAEEEVMQNQNVAVRGCSVLVEKLQSEAGSGTISNTAEADVDLNPVRAEVGESILQNPNIPVRGCSVFVEKPQSDIGAGSSSGQEEETVAANPVRAEEEVMKNQIVVVRGCSVLVEKLQSDAGAGTNPVETVVDLNPMRVEEPEPASQKQDVVVVRDCSILVGKLPGDKIQSPEPAEIGCENDGSIVMQLDEDFCLDEPSTSTFGEFEMYDNETHAEMWELEPFPVPPIYDQLSAEEEIIGVVTTKDVECNNNSIDRNENLVGSGFETSRNLTIEIDLFDSVDEISQMEITTEAGLEAAETLETTTTDKTGMSCKRLRSVEDVNQVQPATTLTTLQSSPSRTVAFVRPSIHPPAVEKSSAKRIRKEVNYSEEEQTPHSSTTSPAESSSGTDMLASTEPLDLPPVVEVDDQDIRQPPVPAPSDSVLVDSTNSSGESIRSGLDESSTTSASDSDDMNDGETLKRKRIRACYRLPSGFVHVCKPCNKKFRDSYNLKKHKQAWHPDKLPFQCSICNKGFITKYEVEACEAMHDDQKEFMCQQCHIMFDKADKLRKHNKRVHGTDDNSNIIGSSSKKSPDTTAAKKAPLQTSSSSGTTEAIGQPAIPSTSKSAKNLSRVRDEATAARTTTPKATSTGTPLKNSSTQTSKAKPNRHDDDDDDRSSTSSRSDEAKPTYWFCPNRKCGRRFKSKGLAAEHKKSCQRFECPRCPKRYSQNQTLQQHVLQEHRDHFDAAGREIYKCHHCNKEFIRKSDFDGHMATHTKFRPFRCRQCDRSYTQKSELSKHVKAEHK